MTIYSGDDRRGGRLFKWVSSKPYRSGMDKAQCRALLNEGKLYVAHFADLDHATGYFRNDGVDLLDRDGEAKQRGRGRWIHLSLSSDDAAPNAKRPVGEALKDLHHNNMGGFDTESNLLKMLFTACNKIGVMELNRPEDVEWSAHGYASHGPLLFIALTKHGRPNALGQARHAQHRREDRPHDRSGEAARPRGRAVRAARDAGRRVRVLGRAPREQCGHAAPMTTGPDADILAAVDLGSNSFHMVVARVVDRHPMFVDRLREPVRLGAGLDETFNLDPQARVRALETLERFGDRLKDVTGPGVRAVGTQTLRRAKNARSFLEEAEVALGHPIEIIAGDEEARLIYLGVCHSRATGSEEKLLVVDIGGGSTELILGTGFEPEWMRSSQMGCVSFTKRFFGNGVIKKKRLEDARLAARIEMRPLAKHARNAGWERAIGASGTVRHVQRILRTNGWTDRYITLEGILRFEEELARIGRVDKTSAAIEGLNKDRALSMPGGLMVLKAVMEAAKISELEAATGALREGVLFDLLGRMRHEDIRDRAIRTMQERYAVDIDQAKRVEQTALELLDAVAKPWKVKGDAPRRFLSWASRLHEIGLAVSYASHQRHGAYLITHSEMAGFSQEDRALLSALVDGQRSSFPLEAYASLPPRVAKWAPPLTGLLRLSIRMHRGRSWDDIPELSLKAGKGNSLRIGFPPRWLSDHPLTRGDLEKERARLKEVALSVEIAEA